MGEVNPNEAVGEETESGLMNFDEIEETGTESVEEEPISSGMEGEAEAEAEAEDLTLIKAMRGENSHEMPEDAIFTQKVNGVDTEVSLRELLNNYSGKTDWTKKYTEMSQEKQALKKQTFEFNDRVNTFVDKAKESKIDALAYLASTAGADPVEFIKEFKQGLIPELEEYMGMSESERKAYDYKQELEILKKTNETERLSVERTQEFEKLEAQTKQYIEELGVDNNEFTAAYDRLMDSGIVQEGVNIGPEDVAQWIGLENRVTLVSDTISEINPELAEDLELVEDLVKTSLDGGLDEQSTIEVINELYGQPSEEAKSASKKARQSNPKLNVEAKKIVKNDMDSGYDSGPLSFDDI